METSNHYAVMDIPSQHFSSRPASQSNMCVVHTQEYEIACQLRMVSMKVQKEKVYRWTVWKRYSEFLRLDA